MAKDTQTLEIVGWLCQTNPINANPDIPHCDGTFLAVVRVREQDAPDEIVRTSISMAEAREMDDRITDAMNRARRLWDE